MTNGPLHGVRVLEFSIVLAGPWAGMQLADLGAEIIKVEQPPRGDPVRYIASPIGASKYFQVINRGRQSLMIDLSGPEGREVIHRLIPSIDVVLINYRPGVPQRLGIDYETLSAIRPDLIYAEISGWGHDGPLASLSASDQTASAYGGAIALTNAYEEDGAPHPLYPPIAGDQPTGLATALGIVSALYHRALTGEGQMVRTSLLRSVISMTSPNVTSNGTDPVHDPAGRDLIVAALAEARERGASYPDLVNARRRITPPPLYNGAYRVGDGGIAFGAVTPANRAALRRGMELIGDDTDAPGFDISAPGALDEVNQRHAEIKARLLTRTLADWMERFNAEGAPAAPVNFPEDLVDDPQAMHHFAEVEHPVLGTTKLVKPMVDLDRTPTSIRQAAPMPGADSAAVARSAGYSDEEVAGLIESGVLFPGN